MNARPGTRMRSRPSGEAERASSLGSSSEKFKVELKSIKSSILNYVKNEKMISYL